MTDYLSEALHYASLGYAVFPCAPGGKVPACPSGVNEATTKESTIEMWWGLRPDCNIGLSTAGLLVVDIDGSGNQWLADDPDKAVELAAAPLSLTANGGKHFIFRADWGRNTAGKLAHKVDTRGQGGYIIAPPSKLSNGKAYRWADSDLPEVAKLPQPPFWLIAALSDTPKQRASTPDAVQPIPEGRRNATLASMGGSLRRLGFSEAEILATLTKANAERCHPPLPGEEVGIIAASTARYAVEYAATAEAQLDGAEIAAGLFAPAAEAVILPEPPTLPVELLRVPGFVSDVMDYTLATAPYPNVAMAFSGALCLQSVLAGRKVRDEMDNRTNLYLLGLAFSASGKDWPRKINTRIMHEIGMLNCLADSFGSGEGIQDALLLTPCMLFQTDEIDSILQSINKARDAKYENILQTLLKMFSSSSSVYPVRRLAKQEASAFINQPSLTIFGTAVPNTYYEALSERMLNNGFLARMLIVECGARGKGQETTMTEIPEKILETARWWSEYRGSSGNLADVHPTPAIVPATDDARQAFRALRDECESEYASAELRCDAAGTTVWGRVTEHARKLALLYAVSENHQKPIIGELAVEWAAEFARCQARRLLWMTVAHIANGQFHSDCLRVKRKLREAPGHSLSHSVLLKRMKMDAKVFASLISTLSQQGDIAIVRSETGGRPFTGYQLMTSE